MGKGSTRITIRVGDELLELIDEELAKRKTNNVLEPWNRSDWLLQAIVEKLSHARRSRKQDEQVRQWKEAENQPRVVEEA